MGLQLKRAKTRNLLLSVIYRMQRLLPFSSERRLRLWLDLEWIFDRLAHEESFRYYQVQQHPFRRYSREF